MKLTDITHRDQFPEWLVANGVYGNGVEVGVFRGEYANVILRKWHGTLTGVDCYNYGREFDILMDAIRLNMRFIDENRYKIIVGESVPTSHRVDGELAFAYIDADHTYPSVRDDIAAWWPKVRSGGVLCGHDYRDETNGVRQAVNEWIRYYGLSVYVAPNCASWFIEKP